MLRVLVLGAGFGGLEVAAGLSEQVPDEVEITLVDRNAAFTFGFSKLDVVFRGAHLPDLQGRYADVRLPSVTFRQETVTAIDPDQRRVTTDAGIYDADVLVVALGAELDVAGTPGLADGGHQLWSVGGAVRTAQALPAFTGGHAVVAVAGTPFKCPPAPSETALMLHDYLRQRGLADGCEITLVSPLPVPVPPSPATSDALLDAFAARGITYLGGQTMTAVDPGRSVSLSGGNALSYDLLLGVPLHVSPRVVAESGLCRGGWVDVDKHTLATPFPGVYAIGDVANAPVPRAGVYAERAAKVVVEQVVAQVRGGEAAPYDDWGSCYIEFGDGRVGQVEVTFITDDGPQGGPFTPPSHELALGKQRFATSRLERWFGRPVALHA